MTGPETPRKRNRRDKLGAIIRDRLELDEDWFPITGRPSFFDKVEKSSWNQFEAAFGRLVALGCRWDAMLTCLALCDNYNTEEVLVRPARFDADGELSAEAKMRSRAVERPPGKDKRISIRANLAAAIGTVKRYENLLFELGELDPPAGIFGPSPLSSAEAVIYLPRLLKWCTRLLADESIGNFRTVENAGRIVPCVYVELVTPETNPRGARDRRLPLNAVAELLHGMSQSRDCNQAQLREAMSRFRRHYGRVYGDLKAKISLLHRSSASPRDGWLELFSAEPKRRRRTAP